MNRTSDHAVITVVSLKLSLPGCSSLKEKRGRLQPILTKLHREFNLSAAEIGLQDFWQSALITCALVSNDGQFNQKVADQVIGFIESHFPGEPVEEYHVEQR